LTKNYCLQNNSSLDIAEEFKRGINKMDKCRPARGYGGRSRGFGGYGGVSELFCAEKNTYFLLRYATHSFL
jgi:hypothetical protein